MGMYEYAKTARLYRGDRKSDPVRTPCFSDPAFHKANRERLAKYAKSSQYRYYDVQNFWSGDEQYLGMIGKLPNFVSNTLTESSISFSTA